jgi:hypothetical protein
MVQLRRTIEYKLNSSVSLEKSINRISSTFPSTKPKHEVNSTTSGSYNYVSQNGIHNYNTRLTVIHRISYEDRIGYSYNEYNSEYNNEGLVPHPTSFKVDTRK